MVWLPLLRLWRLRHNTALVKSIATSATRVGEAANYGLFFWRVLPDDVALARDKLREAQKLLLGAHALLRAAAVSKGLTAHWMPLPSEKDAANAR
jgi:hypothetical protein